MSEKRVKKKKKPPLLDTPGLDEDAIDEQQKYESPIHTESQCPGKATPTGTEITRIVCGGSTRIDQATIDLIRGQLKKDMVEMQTQAAKAIQTTVYSIEERVKKEILEIDVRAAALVETLYDKFSARMGEVTGLLDERRKEVDKAIEDKEAELERLRRTREKLG